jgi:hypothetical protein
MLIAVLGRSNTVTFGAINTSCMSVFVLPIRLVMGQFLCPVSPTTYLWCIQILITDLRAGINQRSQFVTAAYGEKEEMYTYEFPKLRHTDCLRKACEFHKDMRQKPLQPATFHGLAALFQHHTSHIISTAVGSLDEKAITYADRKAGVALASSLFWKHFRAAHVIISKTNST